VSNHKLPDTSDQEASRLLVENARALLDQLDLIGGRAPRAEVFAHCSPGYIGRMIPTAARNAGYDGHDDAELNRMGRERLFWEAEQYLLELGVLVDWSGTGEVLAIDYTNLVPFRPGEFIYVPGTTYRQNQREQALTELRTLLMPVRDQFSAAFARVIALYREQIRRGQLKGDARDDALDRLMQVAYVLVDPEAVADLRSPAVAPVAAKKRAKTPSAAVEPEQPAQSLTASSESLRASGESLRASDPCWNGADIKRERLARGMTQVQLAEAVGMAETQLLYAEKGNRPTPPWRFRLIQQWFREHPIVNGQN